MNSVLQDWVMELPLRMQGTLLTGVRGCDLAPKHTGDTTERRLTAFLRYCFMNPADPREVDIPHSFFQSEPPADLKPSALMHYPLHWYSHVMHAFEVVAYMHPKFEIAEQAFAIYDKLVSSLHLEPESEGNFERRMKEDRIAAGNVVS